MLLAHTELGCAVVYIVFCSYLVFVENILLLLDSYRYDSVVGIISDVFSFMGTMLALRKSES